MKYNFIEGDVEKLFYDVLNETSIPQWVEFKLISNDKLKEAYQIRKVSEIFEFITGGVNIVIVLNEVVFDELTDELKKILFHEILAGVVVSESDKITINKYDFTTYSGMLSKYGGDKILILKETIKSLFDKINNDENKE